MNDELRERCGPDTGGVAGEAEDGRRMSRGGLADAWDPAHVLPREEGNVAVGGGWVEVESQLLRPTRNVVSPPLAELFFEAAACCRALLADLEDATEMLVLVGEEVRARRARYAEMVGLAESLARNLGGNMVEDVLTGTDGDLGVVAGTAVAVGKRDTGALDAAIAKAQSNMRNPLLDKSNPHFRSSYVSLAAVRDAVVPAFAAEGVACTQHPTVDGQRLTVRTRLAYKGEVLVSDLSLTLTKTDPQSVGSAITYARRYSLLAVANLVGDEDDDAEAAHGRPFTPTAPAPTAAGATVAPLPPNTVPPAQWLARIETAGTLEALMRVGNDLTRAPQDVRDAVRKAFEKRQTELQTTNNNSSKKESAK